MNNFETKINSQCLINAKRQLYTYVTIKDIFLTPKIGCPEAGAAIPWYIFARVCRIHEVELPSDRIAPNYYKVAPPEILSYAECAPLRYIRFRATWQSLPFDKLVP